jgi:hypothetical protein
MFFAFSFCLLSWLPLLLPEMERARTCALSTEARPSAHRDKHTGRADWRVPGFVSVLNLVVFGGDW